MYEDVVSVVGIADYQVIRKTLEQDQSAVGGELGAAARSVSRYATRRNAHALGRSISFVHHTVFVRIAIVNESISGADARWAIVGIKRGVITGHEVVRVTMKRDEAPIRRNTGSVAIGVTLGSGQADANMRCCAGLSVVNEDLVETAARYCRQIGRATTERDKSPVTGDSGHIAFAVALFFGGR